MTRSRRVTDERTATDPGDRPAVTLRCCDSSAVDAARLAQAEALLGAHEHAKVARLVRPADRANTLMGRLLVRELLAEAVPGTDPADWRILAGEHDRPLPQATDVERVPFVSIAHTDSIVVAALSHAGLVGVDIECASRRAPLAVARRFFSPIESARFEGLDSERSRRLFWRLWTLKEAWLKARGTGITGALNSTTIELDPPRLAVARDDDPAAWQLLEPEVLPGYQIGLALRAPELPMLTCNVEPRV